MAAERTMNDDDGPCQISVTRRWRPPAGATPSLRRAINAALAQHGASKASISVVLVTDEMMADLNQKHLNHLGPTDVLTFDYAEPNGNRPAFDGEIVICGDVATREAARRGHSVTAELCLYAVHGVLHLLGYDDHDPAQSEHMHACEDRILESIGIGAVFSNRTPRSQSRRTTRTPLRSRSRIPAMSARCDR